MDDRLADHPEQVHLTGRAGSVAVFNGSLWHSSYRNHSSDPRRTPLRLYRPRAPAAD